MESGLFKFDYESKTSESGTNHLLNLIIYDIKWLLENQTNREIRPRKTISEDGDTEECEVKIRFMGEENELVKIYFKTKKSAFLSYKLDLNLKSNFIQDKMWVPKNVWHLITVQTKNTVLEIASSVPQRQGLQRQQHLFGATPPQHPHRSGQVELKFKFLIFKLEEGSTNDNAVQLCYPPEEYDMPNPDDNLNASASLSSLLMNKDFCDVTVKSVDGKEFPAHKCFLAVRSAVFKAHFKQNPENKYVVGSPFEMEIVKNVLCYVYTYKCPKIYKMPRQLLKAAEFYQLHGLKKRCEIVLDEQLTVDNAVEMLELANVYRAKYLKRKTLEFISNGLAGEITLTKGWKDLQSADTIKSIYEYLLVK